MKINIFQKLGLFFYETIDRGFLFVALKSVNRFYRYGFYLFFLSAAYVFNSQIINLVEIQFFKPFLFWVNMSILFFLSFMICYETLFKIDVEEITEQRKEKRRLIKLEKLQWWRLRNMNMFYRYVFYITVYIVIQQILIFNALYFMQSVSFSKSEYTTLLSDFNHTMHYFTFSYILVVIALDYFVEKERKKILKLKELIKENENEK